jgi:hypothetical protein
MSPPPSGCACGSVARHGAESEAAPFADSPMADATPLAQALTVTAAAVKLIAM